MDKEKLWLIIYILISSLILSAAVYDKWKHPEKYEHEEYQEQKYHTHPIHPPFHPPFYPPIPHRSCPRHF